MKSYHCQLSLWAVEHKGNDEYTQEVRKDQIVNSFDCW